MRLLVFGGWGQLGTDLVAAASGRHDLVRPPHSEVDISDAAAVHDVTSAERPDVVICAAAFHKVDLCEEEPETAFRINASGALHVARAADSAGARPVFISTDYVFDGDRAEGYAEDDPVRPLNVYGASKAAGEFLTGAASRDGLVVRGSGLFGVAGSSGKGGNFVETMLGKGREGAPLTVVDDQVFAPTATADMAERILLLLEHQVPPGVYHAANRGACSWFELAARIFELAGVDADLTPRPTAPTELRRPRCSVLLDTKSPALGLPPMRPWEDALLGYLDARGAQVPTSAQGRQ